MGILVLKLVSWYFLFGRVRFLMEVKLMKVKYFIFGNFLIVYLFG